MKNLIRVLVIIAVGWLVIFAVAHAHEWARLVRSEILVSGQVLCVYDDGTRLVIPSLPCPASL